MQQTRQTAPAAQPARPRNPVAPPEFQEGAIARMDAAGLIRITGDSAASEFQKAKACMRLGELGPKEAVPALAALLGNEHLGMYARYGLEPIADPSADDALRAALPRLKGGLLIGVVNSIGKRRDARAVPALAKLMHGGDAEVARAAASALGKIGGEASVRELRAALPRASGLMRVAVADAALACAEHMAAEGKRDQALELFTALTATGIPKPQRLAAMHGIIREETSVERPR